jgi:acyl-coenzyme A thioesterase PaaI-like protein
MIAGDADREFIRRQVLRGLVLNRAGGYHFAGNFLDFSFDFVSRDEVRASLDPGPHCTEADGQINLGAVAVLADLVLASSVRASLEGSQRLATVTMTLQFTGLPLTGRLEAASTFGGFFKDGAGRQGMSRFVMRAGGVEVCHGSGAFMALDPPKGVTLRPMPHRRRGDPDPPLPAERALARDERKVLRNCDAALVQAAVDGGAFIRHFWGYAPHRTAEGARCVVRNTPQIGNRVGHVQGGIVMGLAAATASAALPPTWMLAGISAWYISPGEGRAIKARSRVLHHGRLTAVVRTEVTGKNNRRVLEVVTTHAHLADRKDPHHA